jgi:hypothetical protein
LEKREFEIRKISIFYLKRKCSGGGQVSTVGHVKLHRFADGIDGFAWSEMLLDLNRIVRFLSLV